MLGSLNDRIGLTDGFAFWAVVFAHLSISVSLMGRLDFDKAVRVFVIFILQTEHISLKLIITASE